MLLLDEIIGWSSTLRPWQQEALRRIFSQPELTPNDIEAILQMVRYQESEGDTTESVLPFTVNDVPGVGSGATIKLLGISRLEQVNGFPSGRGFELIQDGMTIFFGQNGAGKSGYARVFKNACKARHRVEVLPNAFESSTPANPASAEFSLLVDGTPETASWVQGGPAHPHLSSVSVYDVSCANDYIDAEGTPAFQPYGLTHLTRLVQLQRELQTRIGVERNALVLDVRQFESLKGDTEVGRYIARLGGDSDRVVLARLGTVNEEEIKRLAFLKRTLRESDPAPRALAMERLATRLEQAKRRAEDVQRWVSDRAIARVNTLITTEKIAHSAMLLAQERLRRRTTLEEIESSVMQPGSTALLDGTGAELWQAMYRAAEAFSLQVAYPEHTFPNLDAAAHCVLCQQPYSADASERMQRFAAFVADSATADAQAATLARHDALKKVQAIDLSMLDNPTLAEIGERLPDLHAAITVATSVWSTRHHWVCKTLEAGNFDVEMAVLPAEVTLDTLFGTKAAALKADAKTLRTSADPAVRLALTKELAELEARQSLVSHLGAVKRFIQDSQHHTVLSRCHTALNPAGVSRKLTTLASMYVTEALATSMNAELKALGYQRRVQPDLSGRTELGITKVTLRLQDITAKASKILSEGEQRALGMAMFLAELKSLPHNSTVIFDDPSTSLDHKYRRTIAQRLVALAKTRQVLILTHDAVFLSELGMALQQANCSASYKTIGWDVSPGLVTEGLPWATKDTKSRLADLEARVRALHVPVGGDPDDLHERQIASEYSSLRGTIERAIREIFLNNTVQPFSDVVSVEAFGAVIGHPAEEWEALLAVYARACEATEAHDTPGERQLSLPSHEVLLSDISQVLTLVRSAMTRRSAYENLRRTRTEQRKKLLGC